MLATISRLITSSASSRGVHSLMGRPDSAGSSHPTATMWQICSALKVAGVPGRGWSLKTATMCSSSTLSSAISSTACNGSVAANQRVRHVRTVGTDSCKSAAIWALRAHVAACRMILARTTRCCGLFARRMIFSNTCSWRADTWSCGGLAPRGIRCFILS